MSTDTLLGVLAIVAFSLAGYALFLSGMIYRSLLLERGLVERGHLSETAGLVAWAAISLLLGILTVRRIVRTFSQTHQHTGTGASA